MTTMASNDLNDFKWNPKTLNSLKKVPNSLKYPWMLFKTWLAVKNWITVIMTTCRYHYIGLVKVARWSLFLCSVTISSPNANNILLPPVSIGHSFDRLISYVMIIQDSPECIISTCLHFCRCLLSITTSHWRWSGVRQRVKHWKWLQKRPIAVIARNREFAGWVKQWPRFGTTFTKLWNVVGWFTIIDTLHAILT